MDLDEVSTWNSNDESEITTEENLLTTTYRPRPQFSTGHPPHHKQPSHKKPSKHNESVKTHSDEDQINESQPKQRHFHEIDSNDDSQHFSKDRSNKFHSHEEFSKESLSDRKLIHDSLAEGSGDNTSEEHPSFSPRIVSNG